jgi:hypothetical protein
MTRILDAAQNELKFPFVEFTVQVLLCSSEKTKNNE